MEYSQILELHERVASGVILLSDEKEYLASLVSFVETRLQQHEEIEKA